jgi:hypothetical protein
MKRFNNMNNQNTESKNLYENYDYDDAQWRAFRDVAREALECVIDHAVVRIAEGPEEIEALAHLRDVVRARCAEQPAALRSGELLHALAILLGAFDVDELPFHDHDDTPQPIDGLVVAAQRLRHIAQAATGSFEPAQIRSHLPPSRRAISRRLQTT